MDITPINDKKVKSFEELTAKIKFITCEEKKIFAKAMSLDYSPNHNRAYCEQVDICMGDNFISRETIQDAQDILSENIPKAVLLGVMDREIAQNLEANINLRNFEEKNKTKLCPAEKIEASCEKDIRNALVSVSGSFIGYKSLEKAPLSNESLEDYLGKNLFSKKTTAKISKDQLKKSCGEKINFGRICKARDERLKVIASCEKDKKATGCLNYEQKALASLNDSHKDNRDIFLKMEKDLCVSSRVVEDIKFPSRLSMFAGGINSFGVDSENRFSNFANGLGGGFQSTLLGSDLKDNDFFKPSSTSSSFAMQDFSVAEPTHLKFDLPEITTNFKSSSPVVSSSASSGSVAEASRPAALDNDNESVSGSSSHESALAPVAAEASHVEDYAAAPSVMVPTTPAPIAESPVNNNFAFGDNYNTSSLDNNLAKPVDKNESIAELPVAKTSSAANAQINGLKSQIDELKQTVADLEAKTDPAEKAAVTEEALAKERDLLDLKKKLADLEAEKKKRDESTALAVATERDKASEARRIASINAANQNFAAASAQNFENSIKRDEKNISNFAQPASFVDPGAGARSPASSSAGASQGQGLVLNATDRGSNNSESNTVYMTDSDLQKFTYRLGANASAEDIEKMIETSHGAKILIGNDEQVIPTIEANGKVKYKRVKISLVKDEKAAKAKNSERKTASVGDLTREEDEKNKKARELARYNEFKNSFLKATQKGD